MVSDGSIHDDDSAADDDDDDFDVYGADGANDGCHAVM